MSAPETNVDKQAKRHRPSIVGISVVLIFVAIITVVFSVWLFAAGDEPEGADTQIDGRTGEVVSGEGDTAPAANGEEPAD
ncbi:hypothetical protein [Pelagovum pacificum]|uniref:Uncharacterized protein n=1 Tax=Pelagovum pacificum TaxID=2588711 RepID=A0A5C5GDN0_9RHOB|nr:hypothetical protein [Pelagovum pacificum]QQA43986.1 hypothetical protein I8N54_05255 [Pelagovum pacificum]TNY32885.1 hypothetical protein FHY64_06305 [Pelagovum pacificum]